MNFLLILILMSVIPDVYKTEDPLGSCSKNEPFRMDDGNCVNFRQICIKEENSQCKSVLNACSQCPPSGYTISMLATLNEKINAITNSSNSTRTIVQLLPALNDKMNEFSTLKKEIINIKNMSDSTRKLVELLPTLNYIRPEFSTLKKEIINIKNMSDSTRKLVELLPDLNVTRNETLTIRKEIKDLKNDGICLKTLCILSFIGIAFIIGFGIFEIVKDKMRTSKKEKPETVNRNVCGENTQSPNTKEKKRQQNIQNQVFRKQSDSRKSNEEQRLTLINNQPGTSKCISNNHLGENNTTKSESEKIMSILEKHGQDILNSNKTLVGQNQALIRQILKILGGRDQEMNDQTPGPFDNVFGKLDETNEKLDKIMSILEKHGQDIVNSNKTLVGQNQALIRQILKILGGRDQEMNDQTPGQYDNVFGKLDETNERLNKILKTLVRRDQEMNDQIISVSTGLSKDMKGICSILDRMELGGQIKKLENTICNLEKIIEKLNAQKTEQITTSAVPEGVGGSNTKQRRTSGPEDDPPSSQSITQLMSNIRH